MDWGTRILGARFNSTSKLLVLNSTDSQNKTLHSPRLTTPQTNSEPMIDLTHFRHFPSVHDLQNEAYASLAHDVANDITLHLQRPGRLDVHSDVSMLGIKVSFLDSFIKSSGGRSALKEYTTERVKIEFVMPATKESRLSYCELLRSQGRTDIVGTAEWFYSHAW